MKKTSEYVKRYEDKKANEGAKKKTILFEKEAVVGINKLLKLGYAASERALFHKLIFDAVNSSKGEK
tara:strand:- start:933 stop:1133 length:201 start_codon:yes stop_codon:yes gene_type:complete